MSEASDDRPDGRLLRADARRNRERVLAVARDAFAAEGPEVPVDEIARRAGVGPGTLYRHFPTKEALFAAVVEDRLRALADSAWAGADSADPVAAFFDFVGRVAREASPKKDLVRALDDAGVDGPRLLQDVSARLHAGVAALLRAAQSAGGVRSDIGVDDLLALMATIGGAAGRPGVVPDRIAAVFCDGLRATARG